jgi:uncharacterized alkaline shock family protein YloU
VSTAPERPGPGAVPPGERGATHIADRVVARIAAEAAREALRRVPGVPTVPPGHDPAPGSTARVHENTARVRLSVELGYPSDIGAQCGAVRRHVASRVREMTGMDVAEVTVGVDRLHSEHLDGERGRVR